VDHSRFGTRRIRHRSYRVFPLSSVPAQAAASSQNRSYQEVLSAIADAQSANASLALLLVDLADIRTLQARLGFEASAELLDFLTREFCSALRPRGRIVRFGDGRFCVIVDAIRNRGHALLAGEKLIRVARDLMMGAAVAIEHQISIGVALLPGHATQPSALLRCAQLAAATARAQSISLKVFDETCEEQVVKPWKLGEDFAKALDMGELSVYYQPKIKIDDGRTAGVEALSRWMRDGGTVAAPDVFVPLAEQGGLIHNLTWYLLSNALRTSADCDALPVAINVTASMLHHKEFLDMIRTAVSTWALDGRILTLEITEGALIADFNEAVIRLGSLRDAGLRISIDDFGTGYSSLSYFKKIPADELKIDKSFVTRMLQDRADQRLVETIITLARQFKLQTVAEGVEDTATLQALAAMGCDYAQGFLYSPAISNVDLKAWLQTTR
jgi:diguanylate cyclase (GGDEF)-like protein